LALPDFIIIGAMKCATSTLAAQLGAQPGIFMTTPKEPNFFSDDANFAKGMDWYQNLFAGAEPGDILGEASTHYSKLPTYPNCLSRLSAALDEPKIIYLIRDPIVRAVSHYIHEWTMGTLTEDFDTALAENSELVAYGRYGSQIAPFVDTFGSQNILLLSFDLLECKPQQALEQVCSFLGYTKTPVWTKEHLRENKSADRIRRFPLHDIVIGNPVATMLRRTFVPQPVRDRIKQARRMPVRPTVSGKILDQLQDVYSKDYQQLRTLFPDADGLEANYPFLQN